MAKATYSSGWGAWEAKTKLSRRAVACKGWRWLPGMRVLGRNYGYARVLDVWADGLRYAIRPTDGGVVDVALVRSASALPDLDNPATLGCIEHELLPNAWGPDAIIICTTRGNRCNVRVISDDGDSLYSPTCESRSRAEALVAALEAHALNSGGTTTGKLDAQEGSGT